MTDVEQATLANLGAGPKYTAFMRAVEQSSLRFHATTGAAPIINVNLMRLKRPGLNAPPATDAVQDLLQYWKGLRGLISSVGRGRVLYVGEVSKVESGSPSLVKAHAWDVVVLVEYPSLDAYAAVVRHPEFLSIKHRRAASIDSSVLSVTSAQAADGSSNHEDTVAALRLAATAVDAPTAVLTIRPSAPKAEKKNTFQDDEDDEHEDDTVEYSAAPVDGLGGDEGEAFLVGRGMLVGPQSHLRWQNYTFSTGETVSRHPVHEQEVRLTMHRSSAPPNLFYGAHSKL